MNKWIIAVLVIIGILFLSLISANILKNEFSEKVSGNKIALIEINGIISTSNEDFLSKGSSSDIITGNIRKAAEDNHIKGILLEINSGGGTVVASEEIVNEIKIAKEKKPVVAFIREVGASGAYWAASAADVIVADPMSLTGSIGVLGSYLEFSGLLESYNITYERLIAGNYKDIGTPFKKLNEGERDILQSKLDLIYNYLIEDVAKNRNMSLEKTRSLADGAFYLGIEAKENGLIDVLGNKETAFNITKEKANITEAVLVSFKENKGLLDILSRYMAYSSYYLGRGLSNSFIYEARNKVINIRA